MEGKKKEKIFGSKSPSLPSVGAALLQNIIYSEGFLLRFC